MARLYRHKRWGWQIHYWIYFSNGTKKKKYRLFKNKLLAQNALRDIEALEYRTLHRTITREDLQYFVNRGLISKEEADRILGGPVEIPTLGELAERFLARSEIECRPRVHQANRVRIQHLLDFFGLDTLVTKIDTKWIEQYRAWRLKTITAATVNKEIIKLAQLLDMALETGVININPARKIKRLRDTRERKPRALTSEEIERLLQVAKAERRLFKGLAYPIILTYLYTGMRREELLYLEWEDVDFERRQIRIQAKIEKDGFVTKTGRARTIGLAQHRAEVLKNLPRKGRYVFGGDSPLIRPDGVTHAFRKLADKAGLPRSVTLHSLRHTYITHLLEKGVNPKRVQELAGHAVFATTWRYAHALPSNKVEEDLLDF